MQGCCPRVKDRRFQDKSKAEYRRSQGASCLGLKAPQDLYSALVLKPSVFVLVLVMAPEVLVLTRKVKRLMLA